MTSGRIKHNLSSDHVCLKKFDRAIDASIHVRFGRKMNDGINFSTKTLFGECESRFYACRVNYVFANKTIVWIIFYGTQIRQISGVGQFIQIDNADIFPRLKQEIDEIASDESGSASNQYDRWFKLHLNMFSIKISLSFLARSTSA
jgi:hypothetical protein